MLPILTPVYQWLVVFTTVYLYLPLFTRVYLSLLVLHNLHLTMFSRAYLCLLAFSYIHLFTPVHLCLSLFEVSTGPVTGTLSRGYRSGSHTHVVIYACALWWGEEIEQVHKCCVSFTVGVRFWTSKGNIIMHID